MIRLGRGSILSDFTFTEAIPNAAQYGRQYLRAVVKGIQSCEPPVELDVDEVQGAGLSPMECLVVTPTAKRLRYYRTLHFGKPLGASLQVGYYLVGGDRAAGGTLFGGETFGIGRPTDVDVDNVLSIVLLIRDHAVAPAVQEIADLVQNGNRQPGGFFGA